MAGLGNPLTNPSDEEEEEDADFLFGVVGCYQDDVFSDDPGP